MAGIEDVFGRRQARAIEPGQCRCDVLRRTLGEQRAGQHKIVFRRRFAKQCILQHALLIELADIIHGGRCAPNGIDAGEIQKQFGAPLARGNHQHHADALLARPAGAAGTMLKHLGIVGQIGVNHQTEIRQIDAARCDVGGNADPCAPVAKGLKRLGAFVLGQLAGQRDHGESAFEKGGLQMVDCVARVAEHDGGRRFEESQHVDHGMLDIARRDTDRLVFDVGVAAVTAGHFDAESILLVLLRHRDDGARQGCREQQRAACVGRGLEDEFHVLAKAEIEHLVGLVQHNGFQLGDVEALAADVIAQPSRRADHDMRAGLEFALLALRVHAADAGYDTSAGIGIKPFQFAMDLQRQFSGRRDDQCEWRTCSRQALSIAHHVVGDREPVGDGLARAGLRRHQEIAADGIAGEHCRLDGCRIVIIALGQGAGERGTCGQGFHVETLVGVAAMNEIETAQCTRDARIRQFQRNR